MPSGWSTFFSGRIPRKKQWDRLAVVSSVDVEIGRVDGHHGELRVQLAEANDAQIGEIRLTIFELFRKLPQSIDVLARVEHRPQQTFGDHREDELRGAEMKRSFGKDRITRQHGRGDLLGEGDGPDVVLVAAVAERDDEPCVGDGFHRRAYPFRSEASVATATAPARRM